MALFVNLKLTRERQADLMRGATLWASYVAAEPDSVAEQKAYSAWRIWRDSRTHTAGLDAYGQRVRLDRAQHIANHAHKLASVPFDVADPVIA